MSAFMALAQEVVDVEKRLAEAEAEYEDRKERAKTASNRARHAYDEVESLRQRAHATQTALDAIVQRDRIAPVTVERILGELRGKKP